jgi:hypothetical protein
MEMSDPDITFCTRCNAEIEPGLLIAWVGNDLAAKICSVQFCLKNKEGWLPDMDSNHD